MIGEIWDFRGKTRVAHGQEVYSASGGGTSEV